MQKTSLYRELEINKRLEVTRVPIRTIETFPFRPDVFELMQTILEGHDISIERSDQKCVLSFPEGTYKMELFPRVHHERYQIVLPDGYYLYETKTERDDLSFVRFRLDDLPNEVQEQIQREQPQ